MTYRVTIKFSCWDRYYDFTDSRDAIHFAEMCILHDAGDEDDPVRRARVTIEIITKATDK